MTDATLSQVAQQITETLGVWNQNLSRQSDWLGGTASGGPNGDGRYPLINARGIETLVMSPARMADFVSGPAALAELAKVVAELARDQAEAAATKSEAQRVLAEAARGAAVDARNLSQTNRSFAATSEANARYWAELAEGHGAQTSEDREAVQQLHDEAVTASGQAVSSAQAAATSATQAATFNPALYDKKSDTLASSRLSGMIDPGLIPVLVGQVPVVSSGGVANLTTTQQNGIKAGTLVATTDGRRWVYTGTGSKTLDASYIEQGDVTPDYSVIANKPSFYPTNIVNVAGLQAALDGKVSLSATGGQTIAGALYVTNRLNINGGDPYVGSDGPTRSIVIAGGGGWTSTGSTIVAYGISHPSQSGNILIQAADSGTRAFTVAGFQTASFTVRPYFNGATPWDSANFVPSSKADYSDWANPNAQAYVNSNGQKGFISGVTGGDIASQAGVAALELRGGGNGTGAAFLQLHRPGIFATNLGIDTDNHLKIGGWSYGALADHIWHNSNIPTGKWQSSIDAKERFLFMPNGRSYYRSPDGQEWRGGNDNTLMTLGSDANLTVSGATISQGGIYTNGNEMSIRGGSPTIYFRDTDHRSAMIHVNSNTFHILRGTGNDTAAWATVNGRWPMTLNLETNDATFGGSVDARTHVYAGANVYAAAEVYAGNWFRIQSANSGIYWEQFGGGWQMSDGTYMRAYGNKYLYSAGSAGFDGNVNMGSFAVLSDARLKTDIRPLTGHGQLIDRLEVKTYIKGGKPEWGVIAQEVEKVEPMLVIRAGDPNDEWGDEPLRTVDSNSLMFAMLAEVKDLRARVAGLEGRQ